MNPFPDVIVRMAKDPRVKKAFYLEYEKVDGECEECGGMGIVSLFLATMGPFDEPGGGNLISRLYDGKWWCAPGFIDPQKDKDKTNLRFGVVSAPCPKCRGIKKGGKPVYVPMPQKCREQFNKFMSKKRIHD